MKRGIILEISSTEVTVLTPEGNFIKLNKEREDFQIGEEITIDNTDAKTIFTKKNGWKLKVLVSAFAATVLLIVSFLPSLLTNSKVSAYVSMDIKSSIELGITDNLKVVEAKGINEEGKQIIAKLKEWKGRDMDEVISKMVALNRNAGHLETNSNILFSTVMIEKDDRNFEYSLHQKLKDTQEMSQIDNSVKIEMKKASVKDREEASDKGISTGTYLEQTNKKTKNQSSNETEKSGKTQVKENKGNHSKSIVEKVDIKQQNTNNSDPVQTPSNSQVIHEKKQKSVKVSKDTGTPKKDHHALQNKKEDTIKQSHKENDSKKRSTNKEDNHTDKKVERNNIKKEQENKQNKRENNRNKHEVNKEKNQNQKTDKNRKQDQLEKPDKRKQQYQRREDKQKQQPSKGQDKQKQQPSKGQDKQKQQYQRGQDKQKQQYQRGQDKKQNQSNQRDKHDVRNQYQKRHGK